MAASLRRRRELLGLTQEQAAEKAGLHPKHIQRLEGAKANATLTTLTALALAYGTSVPALLQGVDDNQPK